MPSRPPGSLVGTKNLVFPEDGLYKDVLSIRIGHLSKNRFHLSSEYFFETTKHRWAWKLRFAGTRDDLGGKIS